MTQETHEAPPTFEPVHTLELVSVNDSKIIGVSVYSGRAEVTRLFSFSVHTGQNQVNISGLPNVLDQDSFRVEGRGAATIHDVTISTIIPPPIPTTSTELKALELKRTQTEKALQRSRKAIASLETYLGSVNVEHVAITALGEVVGSYESTCEKLDDQVTELEQQLVDLNKAIEVERKKLSGPTGNNKLNLKASIGVFADHEGDVEIALIYAVNSATWSAGYDIRVDMQTKEKPITLIYKGAITQNTGEDWNDIPLTLETATPTFGVGVPSLIPWTLSIYRPPVVRSKGKRFGRGGTSLAASSAVAYRLSSRRSPMSRRSTSSDEDEESRASPMEYRGLAVSSKGNISATFTVPGTITIPSDGVDHNVTIVQLSLDSTMSWVSVPKVDAKTHLNAKIKNASEYTLLSGPASVYVDGSFISRSDVPAVSPDESFDCPLGLDPSIRITYHPRVKKVSQSGFYTKTTNYVFSQRITIFNTKSAAVDNVKIIDQVPVSEDSLITVKLVSPALVAPFSESKTLSGGELKVPPPVKVSPGVVVQWDGADEPGNDVEGLGKDGKFYWVCSVPSQGKVNLVLQWEVTAPVRTDIAGLY